MKKVFATIFSLAMLGACSLVQAQETDSASSNLNNQPQNKVRITLKVMT